MATVQDYLTSVQTNIEKELDANVNALPQGFDKKRFALNCIAVIRDNLAKWKADYSKVKPESIITAFVKGAFLDLDFFNRECYIIPYKDEANFQTDYKGECKLAKKYSKRKIKDIYAKNVRRGDFFQPQIIDGLQSISYKPEPFNDNEIIGTFAVVLFEDGGMLYEAMSKDEIEKIRSSFSKAPNSPAWKNTPGEMYKKTVIRRLLKMIDLHFDNTIQQDAFRQGSDAKFEEEIIVNNAPSVAQDPFIDKAVENTIEEKQTKSEAKSEATEASEDYVSSDEVLEPYDNAEQLDLSIFGA